MEELTDQQGCSVKEEPVEIAENSDEPDYINIQDVRNLRFILQANDEARSEELQPADTKKKRSRSKITPKKKPVYPCETCHKEFTIAKSLKIHIRVHTNERPYQCEVCDKSFKQSGSLKSHMVTHSKDKPYPCEFCTGGFTTSSSLKRHVKKIHDTGKILECRMCDEKFFNMSALKSHKLEFHSDFWKIMKCPICRKDLHTVPSYRRHVKYSHRKNKVQRKQGKPFIYICTLCGVDFIDKFAFVNHRNEHLQYSRRELLAFLLKRCFPCKVCGAEFGDKFSLFSHMANHMEKDFECTICDKKYSFLHLNEHNSRVHFKFECPVCKVTLQGKNLMRHHLKRVHPLTNKPMVCEICKQAFSDQARLTAHRLKYHEKSLFPRRFDCKYCGQIFFTRGYLSRHILKYHGTAEVDVVSCSSIQVEKMFICARCHKCYPNQHALKRHIGQHKNLARRLYQCGICFKHFKHHKNYLSHLKICENTSGESNRGNKQRFCCSGCRKTFASLAFLKNHMLAHSVRFNKCRCCGAEFKRPKSMRRHMQIEHPGEKVFSCWYCDVSFAGYDEMKWHRHSYEHKIKMDTIVGKDRNESRTDAVSGTIKDSLSLDSANLNSKDLFVSTQNEVAIELVTVKSEIEDVEL